MNAISDHHKKFKSFKLPVVVVLACSSFRSDTNCMSIAVMKMMGISSVGNKPCKLHSCPSFHIFD